MAKLAMSFNDPEWQSIVNAIHTMTAKNVFKWTENRTKEGSAFTATLELKVYQEGPRYYFEVNPESFERISFTGDPNPNAGQIDGAVRRLLELVKGQTGNQGHPID